VLSALAQFIIVTIVAFVVIAILTSLLKYDIGVRAVRDAGRPAPSAPEELLRVEIAQRLKPPSTGLALILVKYLDSTGGEDVAPRLRASLRTTDYVMKLDETLTAAVLSDCTAAGLPVVIRRVETALETLAAGRCFLSARILTRGSQRPAEAIRQCRDDLEQAVRRGRNVISAGSEPARHPPVMDAGHYYAELQRYVAFLRRAGRPVSFLSGRMDNPDRYRRRYGEEVLDAALQAICGALQRNLRFTDFLARTDTLSFLICLPATPQDAENIARRISRIIRDTAVPFRHETLKVTASLGIAGIPQHATNLRGALECAAQARNEALRAGPGRIAGYMPSAAAPERTSRGSASPEY